MDDLLFRLLESRLGSAVYGLGKGGENPESLPGLLDSFAIVDLGVPFLETHFHLLH